MKILKGTIFQPNSVKYLKTSLKEYLESVKECYQAQRGKNKKRKQYEISLKWKANSI